MTQPSKLGAILSIKLEGKSNLQQIISLEDIASIAEGLNGIANELVKSKVGRSRKSEELQALCRLGITSIKKGSAILEVAPFQEGQLKLGVSSDEIIQDLIGVVSLASKGKTEEISPQQLANIDRLLKPLNSEKSTIGISLEKENGIVKKAPNFTFDIKKRIQKTLKNIRIQSGVVTGKLVEINLKTNSCQLHTPIKRETFYFDQSRADSLILLLRSTIEVSFETNNKKKRKQIIDFKETGFEKKSKKNMTGRDLLQSGVIGILKHRNDIKDSIKYSKNLRDEVFK